MMNLVDGLAFLVPYLKALHILGLMLWCAGLFALPIMLVWRDPAIGQADYRRIRNATHNAYVYAVTPAAVIAVIAGTWLVFLREVFVPWMYLKLGLVALLVGFHGWVGHVLVTIAETAGTHRAPSPRLPMVLLIAVILGILALVLGKPVIDIAMPDWLTEPQGRHFPFDVPRR